MYNKAASIITVILLHTTIAFCQQPATPSLDAVKVIQPGAALVKLSQQFAFAEGPAVDKAGNIYFTDQPNNKIWKYDVKGKLSLFMEKTGRANGLYIDRQGNIISCSDEKDELWSIDKNKKVTVLLKGFQGHRLNGPNDLWIDKKGGIYFTDPYYQREYWDRKKPAIDGQKVYYLPSGEKEAFVVDSLLKQPNGIVGTPDGKYLYVADIGDNKTYKYQVGENGKLINRQLFVAQGSDGMTIDEQGNIYLAGVGVTIYDSAGNNLGNIPVPAKWVGNLCFGGKNKKLLFITASEAVYTLKMTVRGVE